MPKKPNDGESNFRRAVGGTTTIFVAVIGVLGTLSALPWWVSVAVILTALGFGGVAFKRRELPTRPLEVAGFVGLFALFLLAVREAGDLIDTDNDGPYNVFAVERAVESHIAPDENSATVDAFIAPESIQVSCFVEGEDGERWLRTTSDSFVQADAVYRDFATEGYPDDC